MESKKPGALPVSNASDMMRLPKQLPKFYHQPESAIACEPQSAVTALKALLCAWRLQQLCYRGYSLSLAVARAGWSPAPQNPMLK